MNSSIEVVDFKGDTSYFIRASQYQRNEHGLVEAWYWVVKDWLPQYPQIPIPLFNDWWGT